MPMLAQMIAADFAEMLSLSPMDALWERFVLFLPRLGVAAAVVAVFWLSGRTIARLLVRLGRSRKIDVSVVNLAATSVYIGMLLLGGVTGLGTLGIDVSALVAGVGLTGLALGLALKEIISNALSGILVIVYKPFRENDVISVTTFEGTVRDINLRFTTLETEGRKIFIPNAMVISNAVVVHTGDRSSTPPAPLPLVAAPVSRPKPSGDDPLELA